MLPVLLRNMKSLNTFLKDGVKTYWDKDFVAALNSTYRRKFLKRVSAFYRELVKDFHKEMKGFDLGF